MDKPFNPYLNLPTSTHPPLCRITQQGKQLILTTNFYITNLELRKWTPLCPTNNNDTNSEAAAASSSTPAIPKDPLQPGKVRLHSWQLFTSQAPLSQSQNQTATSVLDLRNTFYSLCLDPKRGDSSQDNSSDVRRKSAKSK